MMQAFRHIIGSRRKGTRACHRPYNANIAQSLDARCKTDSAVALQARAPGPGRAFVPANHRPALLCTL